MSLQRSSNPAIPPEAVLVAKAAFPNENVYMQMRDELGNIYDDALFASVYAKVGQPAIPPWRLALISVMQFAENLSDRQEAFAVRAWIDWKYALSLPLNDSGFHYSVLSEFRDQRLARKSGKQIARYLPCALEASRLPPRPLAAMNRFYACAWSCESPQFPRTRGGNVTPCPQCAGNRCPRVAETARQARMV